MFCLSIRQPWAHYILHHGKDVENRSWPTNVRGRVLIHAAKSWDGEPEDGIVYGEVDAPNLPASTFVRGAIIGSVEIVDCVKHHPSNWAEQDQYQFVLSNPIALESPIPYRGALGFFNVPDSALETDQARLGQMELDV